MADEQRQLARVKRRRGGGGHKPMTETPAAASAFELYYDQGPERSFKKVAEHLWTERGSQGEREHAVENIRKQVATWSGAFKWQVRIIKRDAARAEAKRRKREAAEEKMNEEHAELGGLMALLAAEHIEHLKDKDSLNAQAVVQLFKFATDLQRQATGAATQNTRLAVDLANSLAENVEGSARGMGLIGLYLPTKDTTA